MYPAVVKALHEWGVKGGQPEDQPVWLETALIPHLKTPRPDTPEFFDWVPYYLANDTAMSRFNDEHPDIAAIVALMARWKHRANFMSPDEFRDKIEEVLSNLAIAKPINPAAERHRRTRNEP